MPYFDRFDIVSAHYAFYSDNHGGQFSDAYSRLCRIEESPIRFRPGAGWQGYQSLSDNGKEIYSDLCDKHSVSNPNEIPDDCIIYTLPETFAGPIVNDDYSGLTDRESEIVDSVLSELPDNCYLVLWDSDPEFLIYHDAQSYGWKADNCYRFILMEN